MKKPVSFSIFVLIAFWVSGAVQAEKLEYRLLLGHALTSFDSSMQLSSEAFNSNEFYDLEDDLNLSHSNRLFLTKLELKTSHRHKFSFAILPMKRSASMSQKERVEFDGDTFAIGSTLNSRFNTTAYDFEYAYKIFSSPTLETELIAGIYWMDTTIKLHITGSLAKNERSLVITANYQTSESKSTPLPLFGVSQQIRLSNYWQLIGSVRYFKSSHKHDKNEIIAGLLAAEYHYSDRWDLGFSYTEFDANVFIEDNFLDFDNHINWQYSGPNVYLIFRF